MAEERCSQLELQVSELKDRLEGMYSMLLLI